MATHKNNSPCPSKPAETGLSITVNFGEGNTDTNPTQAEISWEDFIKQFSVPDTTRGKLPLAQYLTLEKKDRAQKKIRDREKNGRYFIMGAFSRPGTRSASDITFMSAFTGDIDTGTVSKSDVQNALNGFKFMAYSSYSHSPRAPMWRFVIPYSRPVTAAEHKKVYAFLQKAFANQLDKRCETTAQLWYTAACPPDAGPHFEWFTGDGALFDPGSIPEPVKTTATSTATANTALAVVSHTPVKSLSVHQLERLRGALAAIPADDRGDWIRIGLALRQSLGTDTGYPIWSAWSSNSAKFHEAEARTTWDSFKDVADGPVVTLATVYYLAKEHGWADSGREMSEKVQALDDAHFVAFEGGKCWVFKEDFDPELKRNMLARIGSEPFRSFYSNQKIAVPHGESFRMLPIADLWMDHPARRTYNKVVFMPGLPTPEGCYNMWRGFPIPPKKGSWGLLKSHITDVICSGDAANAMYLLNWMAFAIQHPDRQGEVAVILKGTRGTGKGKLAYFLSLLFGEHSLQITQAKHLIGNFNAHLRSCVFLFVDEALWAGDKAGENVLKGLITEPYLQIERKGIDTFTAPNRLHIMMASNNDWVIPAGNRERRFFVCQVSDQHIQDHDYFAAIDEQMLRQGGLAAMMHDLVHRDLSTFDVRKFPWTDALDEQLLRTLDPAMQWWTDYLGATYNKWEFPSRSDLSASFAEANGTFNGRGSETKLGMFLSKVLPGGVKKVSHAYAPGASPTDCYQFPSQQLCREALIRQLGLKNDPWL